MSRRPARLARASGVEAGRVRVWDLPTRLFHWLLLLLVVIAAYTKLGGRESWMGIHIAAGYGIVALLAFRFVWAAFGSRYSHIASFAYRPREILDYLRGLVMLRPAHHIGHNPAGAAMIYALTLVLVGLVVTGLLALGGEEKQGPLAGLVGYDLGNAAKALHYLLFRLLLVMVIAHVAGVIAESLLHRDNLVRAMITGWKRLPAGTPIPDVRRARPRAAALAMALLIAVAGATLYGLGRVKAPPMRTLAWNADYKRECGTCHYAYHPSLLPAASWRGIMGNLGDHFGEDASLGSDVTARIEAWLVANAAESWDTEAANRFRQTDARRPLRITATPYWTRKHADLPQALFARKGVGSKANCNACHHDADTGRFDDQSIAIPKE
jgi:cytochrome b